MKQASQKWLALASLAVVAGAPGARADDINEWESRDRRVTSEDVKRVARQYLAPANRTVITVAPGAKQ